MRPTFIVLALVAFAGCLDADEPASEEPQTTTEPEAVPAGTAPEPVSIHEDEDLQDGYPHTTWRIPVSYGGSGMVRVALEAPMDLQGVGGNICWSYHAVWRYDDGSSEKSSVEECSSGISISSTGTIELYSTSFRGDVEGSVEIEFSAEPQLMRFVLDAEVAYPE